MKILRLFKLLLRKNLKKQIYMRRQFALSILVPVFFTLILVVVRFLDVSLRVEEVQSYRIVNYGVCWSDMTHLLTLRNESMVRERDNFQHNTFIPQLVIGYSPNDSVGFKNIMELAHRELGKVTLQNFDNCDDLAEIMYVHNFLMSVCFHDNKDGEMVGIYPLVLNFTIIVPSESRIYADRFVGANWDTNFSYDRYHSTEERANQGRDGGPPGYVREGVISLQYFISKAYIKLASHIEPIPEVFLKRFDVMENMFDKFGKGVQISIGLVYLIGFMYPVIVLSELVVYEAEYNQRYLLNTNGIGNCMQLFAWFINGLIPFFVSSVLCVFLLKISWNGSVSVMEKCPVYLVLIFFLSYSFSAVAFAILISVVCRTSKRVIALIPFVWIIGFLPFLAKYDDWNEPEPLWSLKSVSWVILLNVTLGVGLQRLIVFERFDTQLTIIEFLADTGSKDDYSLLKFIGYFYAQAFLYFALAILIDNSMLSDWLRLCMKYLTKKEQKPPQSNISGSEQFETQNESDKVVIEFDSVSLKFSKRWIIKNFSLKLHENEVVCLYGQNASGKTSIMKMICGLLKPTMGKITIEGYDIWRNSIKAYRNVSVSLQAIPIFREFTIQEIILYFCTIRGLNETEAQADVKKYITVMELETLANTLIMDLTLGQRQLIDVLCAFAGRCKIVLIDKPFEGVDDYNVELLNKFLENERTNRTILIATSKLQKAEIVSDQIAIIKDGELLCKGSIKFLSETYKDGYHLICQRGERCSQVRFEDFLKTYIPGIEKETDYGNHSIYRIDYRGSKQLPTLLHELAKRKNELYLDRFKIVDRSIEYLIYNIYAKTTDVHSRERPQQFHAGDGFGDLEHELQNINKPIEEHKHCHGLRMFFSNIWTLLERLYLLDVRNPLLPLAEILMPSFLAILIFLLPHIQNKRMQQLPVRTFKLDNYPQTVTFFDDHSMSTLMNRVLDVLKTRLPHGNHFLVEVSDQSIMQYMRNKKYKEDLLDDFDMPTAFTFDEYNLVAWFNNYMLHAAPLTLNIAVDAIAGATINPNSRIIFNLRPLPYSTTHYVYLTRGTFRLENVFAIMMTFCYCFIWSFNLLKLSVRNAKGNSNIENIVGLQMNRLAFSMIIYEFIKISFSFIPLNSIVMVFKFRQLMQLGIYFTFVYVMLITAFCTQAYNVLISKLMPDITTGYVVLLIIRCYAIVCFFTLFQVDQYRRPGEADTMPKLNFLPYYCLTSIFIRIFDYSDLNRNCADKETREITVDLEKCMVTPNCCEDSKNLFILELLPMVGVLCLCWVLYLLWQWSSSDKKMHTKNNVPYDDSKESYDEQFMRHFVDVNNRDKTWMYEKIRVRTLERIRLLTKPLHCQNLCVQIGNKIVLTRLNFMIERYQCMALLGQNGVGKSTLIKTILGKYGSSNGYINVNYSSNTNDLRKTRKRIGYCPQKATLLDGLTLIEIFETVLLIRGMPRKEVTNIAAAICKAFDFYRFRYHTPATCSWGIVQRVHVALSMIGHTKLILLDDPFAMIDVSGKRLIFHMIDQISAQGQAVLISSGSPDDCVLMNRVAFLKDRSLVGIGEVQKQLLLGYYENYIIVAVNFRLELLTKYDTSVPMIDEQVLDAMQLHRRHVERLKMAKFMKRTFPCAIVRNITANVVSCWFSLEQCTYLEVFNTLVAHADYFNSFSVTHVNLNSLFLDYGARPDRRE